MKKPVKNFFTLLEVLVSMGVFSLLMLALMQFFSAAQGVWDKTGSRAEMVDSARIAMSLLQDDLAASYYQNDYDGGNFQFFDYDTSNTNRIIFAAQKEDGNAEIRYLWDSSTGKLHRYIKKEADAGFASGSPNPTWFTRGNPSKDWVSQMKNHAAPADDSEMILENVLSFEIKCYPRAGNTISTTNSTLPDSTGSLSGSYKYAQIPYLVNVTMVLISQDALDKLAVRGYTTYDGAKGFKTLYDANSAYVKNNTLPEGVDGDADTDQMILIRGCQVFQRVIVIDRSQY